MKVINPSPWVKEPKLEVIELPKEKICISTQDGHQVIIKDEISCLIADSNYTTIHIDGQSILCAQTLSHVLHKLNLPEFIRVHRSYAVNINKIKHIDYGFNLITTYDGDRLMIARSRKQEIRAIVMKHFD